MVNAVIQLCVVFAGALAGAVLLGGAIGLTLLLFHDVIFGRHRFVATVERRKLSPAEAALSTDALPDGRRHTAATPDPACLR